MKPWEETWGVTDEPYPDEYYGLGVSLTDHLDLVDTGDGDQAATLARAKLAAAAPEMARLLLKLLDKEGRCAGCDAHSGAGEDDMLDPENHHDGCALAAVLLKAGVASRT